MSRSTWTKILLIASMMIHQPVMATTKTEPSEVLRHAKAVLLPTQGHRVSGVVIFSAEKNGVKITAELSGLTPGKHGFHIHELGDCSAADATSAGGHFNPDNMEHGAPNAASHHEGDLGNIEANSAGKASYEYLDKSLSFSGKNSILGRSVIVHEHEDDFKTQPTGNSGNRLACGVIGVIRP